MVRSMYSGVAGMKANQTGLDVIGNNIANSHTYGFKSSRATFRDMYYQQLRGASAGTATRGGINPSMVGYGAQIASIDLLMTQSSMTSTGNPLDVCITGEGFLQVMDPDGNIYYTCLLYTSTRRRPIPMRMVLEMRPLPITIKILIMTSAMC